MRRPPTAEISLPARGRFDLRATVLSHGYHELAPCRWEEGPIPTFHRIERLATRSVYRLAVRPAARGVVLRVTGRDATEAEVLAPLAARMRRALRLDEDFADFHRLCRLDPALRPIARLGMGRLLRGTTLFEDLVKAIAWTNTTWRGAVSMIERLGRLGSRYPAEPRLRAFPTPEQILSAGERGLRDRAGLGYRAPYLIALAERVAAGALDLETLAARASTLPSSDLARALAAIRGAGPATVAYGLMLLGHYDRPAIDSATLRFAADALYGGHPTTVARLEKRFARYGEWSALVLWFLQWHAGRHAVALLEARRRAALTDTIRRRRRAVRDRRASRS
jgi:3-methyladenine DNA glycosylase/8-oxoguanine DNA glycosylase